MDASQLRTLMKTLEQRVRLSPHGEREIIFDVPTAEELLAEGFDAQAVRQLLEAPWWPEMIEDIVETPEFCAAEEAPEQILRFARDVVIETLRKRYEL